MGCREHASSPCSCSCSCSCCGASQLWARVRVVQMLLPLLAQARASRRLSPCPPTSRRIAPNSRSNLLTSQEMISLGPAQTGSPRHTSDYEPLCTARAQLSNTLLSNKCNSAWCSHLQPWPGFGSDDFYGMLNPFCKLFNMGRSYYYRTAGAYVRCIRRDGLGLYRLKKILDADSSLVGVL